MLLFMPVQLIEKWWVGGLGRNRKEQVVSIRTINAYLALLKLLRLVFQNTCRVQSAVKYAYLLHRAAGA